MRNLKARAVAAASVVAAGIFVAPQPAMAVSIDNCRGMADRAKTYYQVQCYENNVILTDAYRAVITCGGRNYYSSYRVTPIGIGWGGWARVECPSGKKWTSYWYEIRD